MSEELETTQENETTEVTTDDYFASHSELIDDHGGAISDTKADPVSKPAPAPAAANPQADPKAAPVADTAKADIPDGFFGTFFDKDDKGAVNFKAEDAMKMLFPESDDARFKYSPIGVIPDSQAPQPSATDNEPAWKKQLAEERTYRQNLKTNLLTPLQHVRAAIQQGADIERALAYAEQQTLSPLEDIFAERDYQNQLKQREELENQGRTKAEMAELKALSKANEAKYYEKFGGQNAFNQVFFGYTDKAGKQQPGIASDYVWHLFKISNPETTKEKLTGKQLGEKMESWWTKFTSDADNMAFLYEAARGRMMLHPTMKENLINKIRTTAQAQNKANREGTVQRASGLNPVSRTTKSENTDATLNAFFNPSASRDEIASV